MVRSLPAFIELRRDQITQSWFFVCRACGVKERYHQFWPASRAAWDHADMELAELDEQRQPST